MEEAEMTTFDNPELNQLRSDLLGLIEANADLIPAGMALQYQLQGNNESGRETVSRMLYLLGEICERLSKA